MELFFALCGISEVFLRTLGSGSNETAYDNQLPASL